MDIFIQIMLSAVAVYLTSAILPGVEVKSFWTAIWVAIVLGILNAVVQPSLVFLTIPVNLLTLGLFIFVINTIIILLCSAIISNFKVRGFWSAMLFSVVLSIATSLITVLVEKF